MTYDGATYYFCCEGCQKKFATNPAGVLAARAEKDAATADFEEPQLLPWCGSDGGKPTTVKVVGAAGGRDLHLPDASGSGTGRAGGLSDLWDGPGAEVC